MTTATENISQYVNSRFSRLDDLQFHVITLSCYLQVAFFLSSTSDECRRQWRECTLCRALGTQYGHAAFIVEQRLALVVDKHIRLVFLCWLSYASRPEGSKRFCKALTSGWPRRLHRDRPQHVQFGMYVY